MKLVATLIASAFAVTAFAAEPAKTDKTATVAPPAAVTAPAAPHKSETKPAKSVAKVPAKDAKATAKEVKPTATAPAVAPAASK